MPPGLNIRERSEEIFDLDFDQYVYGNPFNPSSIETRSHKKQKHLTKDETTSSCNTSIQVRDYIRAYAQKVMAVETPLQNVAASSAGSEGGAVEEEESVDGMKLVQLLIACAEAVACRDRSHASTLLNELRSSALPFGTSFQRVASCFVQGLSERLTMIQPLGRIVDPMVVKKPGTTSDKEEALHLFYQICPQIQFGHLVANALIVEAFEGESSVHVIDLGMTLGLPHGNQWRDLIDILVNWVGPTPRRIRITGVGNHSNRLRAIGIELELYAETSGVDLEVSVVESSLENLKAEKLNLKDNEILVVNSIFQLHSVVKESRGALNSVLQMIHALNPKVLAVVEQDSSHNGPFFLARFMEALHYYSAVFDSLDIMLPKYDTRRAKIEQFYLAEEIKNIISYEGPARVERHERVDQWRRRMSLARFQPVPIKQLTQAKKWLNSRSFDGYTLVEEKGCLVLGWKSRPIIAASCWKCF